VAAPPIPTWKERLGACFRWRYRLLHVFGVPGAVGAAASVAAASLLNPDTGLALGALVAGVGTLIGGYYVTSGFDRRLVERLQAEKAEAGARHDAEHIVAIVANASSEIRPVLERIVGTHASIEAGFAGGTDDTVERLLQGSRDDLRALRDRALKLVDVYRQLSEVIQQSNGQRLYDEMTRLNATLARMHAGPARKAQEEACASAERTYTQWHNAVDKQRQIGSVFTVIEKNLEEFRLAMALRKVDALEGEDGTTNVSELQARLTAAGEACDQLVGRTSTLAGSARRGGRAGRARA
jgi:hypothetical protein